MPDDPNPDDFRIWRYDSGYGRSGWEVTHIPTGRKIRSAQKPSEFDLFAFGEWASAELNANG